MALAVIGGSLDVDGRTYSAGRVIVLERSGCEVAIQAIDEAKVLVLSGEPIDEPIVGYGPFVMNSEAEIRRAVADFQSGGFGTLGKQDRAADVRNVER